MSLSLLSIVALPLSRPSGLLHSLLLLNLGPLAALLMPMLIGTVCSVCYVECWWNGT